MDAASTLPSPSRFLAYEDVNESKDLDEYSPEIVDFMLEMESKTLATAQYMERQTEITWKLRKTLVMWLIEVHAEYDLRPETLYLAINILDRVSARRIISRHSYQLLGLTALWIAAKYEENHGRVPNLKNLMYICCNTYHENEFALMEQAILRDLSFMVGHPTAESFLKAELRYSNASLADGTQPSSPHPVLRIIARLIMEVTLLHKRFLSYRPSLVARASLTMAEVIMGVTAPYDPNCNWTAHAGTNALNLQQPDRANFFQLVSFNQVSGGISVSNTDPIIAKIMSHLEDCISHIPKQILDKYSHGKFMNVGLHIMKWIDAR
ncbi:cyclin-like protein [Zopfochytrium polystomum]|nr:cyclin-like protein [Zopfochytrium polystomum]